MYFLDVQHVSKRYARHLALDDASIGVMRGRVFGLLGPNGAGKTTLIRIINRITAPDSGSVMLQGKPFLDLDVRRIGYLPEERGLYRKMKVGEQAIYLARLKGVSRADAVSRLRGWFEKFEIMPWWNKKVEELSKGMQQKIQFVCTVIHEPELLIFDEPFSGFDPVNADLLKSEILALRDQGRTVIFSTHNMQSVEEVCDDIALINRSRVVLSGSIDRVRAAHSEGTVELVLDTRGGELPAAYLADLDLIEQHPTNRGISLLFHRRENQRNRDLIAALPETVSLVSFEEKRMSMHDIFIKTVTDTATDENLQ